MPRSPRIPSYRLHKSTGQAVVTLAGRDHYLGTHGSPESREKYQRLLAEYLANNRQVPAERAPDLTVAEVLAAYWAHAEPYYAGAGGKATSTSDRVRRSLVPARQLYGGTPAARFGPVALRACRQWMVEQGWSRRVVNERVGCLVRAFKWATSEELVPPAVYQALRTVEGLRAGRTEAPERPPVGSVEQAHVEAIIPYLLPMLQDVVRVQMLTACRPGEVLRIRGTDLDRSGAVWIYRPVHHKTAWRGHNRVILVGPQAQALLRPYLEQMADSKGACCLFSPRAAVQREMARLGRPFRPGERAPGNHYQVSSYSQAIRRACRKAGIPEWHPHQLRHARATWLTAQYGWDMARILLGHHTLSATRIYADDDLARAAEVMRQVG
jgi:integrase